MKKDNNKVLNIPNKEVRALFYHKNNEKLKNANNKP